MRNYVYLRPGNLYKDFIVETNTAVVSDTGRVKPGYDESGAVIIRGVLADANDNNRIRFGQLGHPVTHTIVQVGTPKAKPEDRLICGERLFAVQGVDDSGSIGICTVYYVEERSDVR